MAKTKALAKIPTERIATKIYWIRGMGVMLDRDLAVLYGVPAIALRQQVKRNADRFPDDFILQLTQEEIETLVSQSVIPSRRSLGGGSPYAFTQEGVAMLSSVLRSKQALRVNIAIMRTYVRLRRVLGTNEELARRVARHDQQIGLLFKHVQALLTPPEIEKKRKIGFLG